STSPCRLVSSSSKSNTATLGGSACTGDETHSISTTTKPVIRMIVVREFTAAQQQLWMYKTVRPCFKPVPNSIVDQSRGASRKGGDMIRLFVGVLVGLS